MPAVSPPTPSETTTPPSAASRPSSNAILPGGDQARADAPLFATASDRPLHRDQLRRLIQRAGDRAGVRNAHPHRFRHPFAIQFLRNEGNIFALQSILGPASMDIVKPYLPLAQMDLDRAHQDASSVSNWHL